MKAEPTLIDLERLRVRRGEILDYAASHGAQNVRVFGSAARGGVDATSDVDLLVEMEPGRSLLDLVGLWQDLEDLLGTHVDVLSDGGVSRTFASASTPRRPVVKGERVYLLHAIEAIGAILVYDGSPAYATS
jgi:predicted nucleotidyltransferase